MPLVAHHATQRDTRGRRRDPRQCQGILTWLHATTFLADVDVDQHPHRRPGLDCRFANVRQPGWRIDRNRDGDASGERGHAGALRLADDLVGDQQIVADPGDDLRFGDRRAGDAGAGASRELPAGDLRRLVRLEVRAELARKAREEAGHLRDVAVERRHIDKQCRRRNVVTCHRVRLRQGFGGQAPHPRTSHPRTLSRLFQIR